jgi:hypothetical protein
MFIAQSPLSRARCCSAILKPIPGLPLMVNGGFAALDCPLPAAPRPLDFRLPLFPVHDNSRAVYGPRIYFQRPFTSKQIFPEVKWHTHDRIRLCDGSFIIANTPVGISLHTGA